jgi:type IV secretion system protein VirB6
MDTPNYIALMSESIDRLGKSFTASTYGAFASQIAPVLSGLLVLYLVFWGFRFWQGKGERSVIEIVLRLFRIAIIFSIATGWGPIQTVAYRIIADIPSSISSVMMNNIVNVGKGSMSRRTVERDLYDFYRIAMQASARIAGQPDATKANPAVQTAQPTDGQAPQAPAPISSPSAGNPADILISSVHSGIVWIAAALFVGYAVFLILFCKLALWVVLALAPGFIVLLMFQGVSRFFSGWLTTAVQTMLVPIFFYAFLGFFLIVIKDIVIGLNISMKNGAMPGAKDIAPFVLVCFSGLFLLIQIIPLSARIAGGTQSWLGDAIQTGAGRAFGALPVAWRGRNAGASNSKSQNASPATTLGGAPSASEVSDTLIRDIQDRNLAINRQRRNR